MTETALHDKDDVRARFTLDALADYAGQRTDTTPQRVSETTRRLSGGKLGGLEITSRDGALLWYLHEKELGGDVFDLFGYLEFGNAKPKGEEFTRALQIAGDFIGAMPNRRTNGNGHTNGNRSAAQNVKKQKNPALRSSWLANVDTTYTYHVDGREWYKDRMKKGHQGAPFIAWHRAADGREIAGRDGMNPTLYRLVEHRQARAVSAETGERLTVFVTAGEKDCDNVRALGFVAVCNPDGEIGEDRKGTKWPDSFSRELEGCSVVIPVDNDDTGRTSAETLAGRLYGIAASVKVLHFDSYHYIPPNGDISDWIHYGNTAEDLDCLIDATPVWAPIEPADPSVSLEEAGTVMEGSDTTGAATVGKYEIFSPTWDNQPPHTEPTLVLDGTRVGSKGNTTAIVAGGGAGKSATVEAICSRAIYPGANAFGFDVQISDTGTVLYIDTERSREDHHTSWRRFAKRAGLSPGDPREVRMRWFNFKTVPTVAARWKELWRLLDEYRPELVLLDGIGDFLVDVNDAEEVSTHITLLQAEAESRQFSLVVTIHPNPKTDKARGHLGSEIWRRAEAMLNILVDKATDIRTISSKGDLGKIRSGSPVEASFRWDDTTGMHVSCESPAAGKSPSTRAKLAELADSLYANKVSYTYSDLVTAISETTGTGKDNAIKKLNRMKSSEMEIIVKHLDGTYIRNGNEGAGSDPF
jgi:hypothetical protein